MVFYIISIIFILSFMKGVLELLGIPETFQQLLIESLIMLLYIYSLLKLVQDKKMYGPGFYINSLLIVVIFISFLITDVNNIQLVLFIRKLLIYYMFFYAVYNIDFEKEQADKILTLIKFLFIVQIIGAFVKLGLIGTLEKIVGTMTVQEGSVATIMPLLAISYLIAHYLEFKNKKAIIFVFLFIAIGLISNKLGILFYVMFLFIFHSYLYSYKHSGTFLNILFLRKMTMVLVLLVVIFAAFVSLNPRANPENKVGGSIDIDYLVQFIDDYQHLQLKGAAARQEGNGRFEAPFVALDRLSERGFLHVLFGLGPGEIIKSSFVAYRDPLLEKYNIGYGGRIGLVWTMMQIGLIGVMLLVAFHFILFKKVLKLYFSADKNTEKKYLVIILGVLGFIALYFIDYFSYSKKLLLTPGIVLTYYFLIYYVLVHIKENITTKDKF